MQPLQLPDPVELSDLLEPFSRRGVDLGLYRLHAALADAGHPEKRFPAVQVAGTNGKGSICTMLGAMLKAADIRTGIYRSPHLLSWCERLELNGNWINPEQLREALFSWQGLGASHKLTPFELITGATFSICADAEIDLAVLEVGLGGRLDATTAHSDRSVVGIGSIGLDHCEYLGNSLEQIAAEKAGVFKPGTIAISAPQVKEVAEVLEQRAAASHTQLRWVAPLANEQPLALGGRWQRSNGAVAMGMAAALNERGWEISEAAINKGLATARWPGRLEQLEWRGRKLLLDGAHNQPAAAALRQELSDQPRRWLLGIQRHKQGLEIVNTLLGRNDQAWILALPNHQSWSAAELRAGLPHRCSQIQQASNAAEGLEVLLAPGAKPVIAGSLYLLSALWEQLNEKNLIKHVG